MRSIQRGYISPEFLYAKVIVPGTSEVEVKPSTFENITPYRKRLVNLAFSSPTILLSEGREDKDVDGTVGFWARQMEVELGKTQCGDQNNVRGSLAAMCSMPYKLRQKFGGRDIARELRLPTPYRLPRDQGLDVAVLNSTTLGAEDFGQTSVGEYPLPSFNDRATFIAKGVYEQTGEPAFLAGETATALEPGRSTILRSADLFNKGRQALLIDRLILKDFQDRYTDEEETDYYMDSSGTRIAWNINPTAGAQWMPSNNFIPVGNLTPMNFLGYPNGYLGRQPLSYYYPQLTYLYPKQTLGVKLINQSESPITVHISLFSELEVR